MSPEQKEEFREHIRGGGAYVLEAKMRSGNRAAVGVWRMEGGVIAAAIGFVNEPTPKDEEEARERLGRLMCGVFGAHEAAAFTKAKGETDSPQFHFQPQVHQAQNN